MREMSEAGMTFGSHGREHIDYSGMEATRHGANLPLTGGIGRSARAKAYPCFQRHMVF